MKTILIVDDERSIQESLTMILEYEKYTVECASSGAEALGKIGSSMYAVVILDVKMPGMDGLETLDAIRQINPDLPVVMISGHGTIETAVEATKRGAFDFLQKPLDRDKILVTIRNSIERTLLVKDYKQIKETLEGRDTIIGKSKVMMDILALIERVAPTDSRILITGENGTGKELVAKAIHRFSRRTRKPLIEVNCAAIPTELIESELFGHEKGSFTGATTQRIGKFEQADEGTIFLDEIGDMSLAAQAKVLRALEEGKIERVGGNRTISVDVRVIAATNKNLRDEITKGQFREDLYHRLNVIPIHVPALHERREDIPLLVRHFVDDICARNGMQVKKVDNDVLMVLESMDWSGNVRELRNMVERLVIMSSGNRIDGQLIQHPPAAAKGEFETLLIASTTFQEFKDQAEKLFIKHQLEYHQWNITKTAEALDIQRSHLYTKMKRYGLMKEE
jgi:two-component system, NtrC family, nitrogen regulation response regulator NtrX